MAGRSGRAAGGASEGSAGATLITLGAAAAWATGALTIGLLGGTGT